MLLAPVEVSEVFLTDSTPVVMPLPPAGKI